MAEKPPPPKCILRGHKGIVSALHFTNEKDTGITLMPSLISGSESGEIFIWNLRTHRSYHHWNAHNGKTILYLFYYKSSLISQGRDELINIWKFIDDEWRVIGKFICPIVGFSTATLFPAEQNAILVANTGQGSSLTFYDYETSEILFQHLAKVDTTKTSLEKSGSPICMCLKVFSKEKNVFLLIGYDGGDIALWDYESKKEKSRLKSHSETVLCLDFDSKYKNRGISGSVDDQLHVWEVTEDDKLLSVHKVTLKNSGVNSVKIRDDGKIVVSAGKDHVVRVFSWKNLRLLAVLEYHTEPVVSLQFYNGDESDFNSYFATGSKDKNIALWSIY